MGRWRVRAAAVMLVVLSTACDDDPTGSVRVDRVEVGPADQVLVVGDSTTVTAVPLTSGGDVVVGPVLWRTLSPTVATLQVSGGTAVVKAVGPGVVRIEAESGGRTGFVNVTVIAAPVVAEVTVLPVTLVLEAGQVAALEAVARTAQGEVVTGRAVTWTVDGAAATVTPEGTPSWARVTAQAPGDAVVRAVIDGVAGAAEIEVVTTAPPPAEVATVEIAPSNFSLPVDHETPLQAIAKDLDGMAISGRAVTWVSTDEAVATITPIGVSPFATFLAKSAGTTKIRASIDGITAEITVTVTAAPPPPEQLWYLFFAGPHHGIWANQLIDMRQFLTGHGSNGPVANPVVVWSIDDPAIATIDENGNVRGLTKGTTRVRATAGDVVATTLVTVYQPIPGPVVYDLTYDWWTGEWHMPPVIGTETWMDGNGVEHDVQLWLTGGSLTLADNGDYTRLLRYQGWVTSQNGMAQLVIDREVIDTGTASIMVGGETGYWMHSTTTPGLVYELVAHQPGNLIMRTEVGTAPKSPYMFRMRQ